MNKSVTAFGLFRKEHQAELKSKIPSDCPDPKDALKTALLSAWDRLTPQENAEFVRLAEVANKTESSSVVDLSLNASNTPSSISKKPAVAPWMTSKPTGPKLKENRGNNPSDTSPAVAETKTECIPAASAVRQFTSLKAQQQKASTPSPTPTRTSGFRAATVRTAVVPGNGKPVASIFMRQGSASKTPKASNSNSNSSSSGSSGSGSGSSSSSSSTKTTPASAAKTASVTSSGSGGGSGGKPKGAFFMNKAERMEEEAKRRKQEAEERALQREQQFQAERMRKQKENAQAFRGKGTGEHAFFGKTKQDMEAARLHRTESLDVCSEAENTAVEMEAPAFPFQRHTGLPDCDYLFSHSSVRHGDTPSSGTSEFMKKRARSIFDHTAHLDLPESSGSLVRPSPDNQVLELDGSNPASTFNLLTLFSKYLHDILGGYTAAPAHVVDLINEGDDASKPIELDDTPDGENRENMHSVVSEAVAAVSSNNCEHLLVELLKPRKTDELFDNSACITQLRSWLQQWAGKRRETAQEREKKARAKQRRRTKYEYDTDESDSDSEGLVNMTSIYGAVGMGKTSIISMLAKEEGYNIVEVPANEYRRGADVRKKIEEAAKSRGMVGPSAAAGSDLNLILFDEIDLNFDEDAGLYSYIQKDLSKKSRTPIILTSEKGNLPFFNDSMLREEVHLNVPSVTNVERLLVSVLQAGVDVSGNVSSAAKIAVASTVNAGTNNEPSLAHHLASVLVGITRCDIRQGLNLLHMWLPQLKSANTSSTNKLSLPVTKSFSQYLCDIGIDFALFDHQEMLLTKAIPPPPSPSSDVDIQDCRDVNFNKMAKRGLCVPLVCSVVKASEGASLRRGGFIVNVDGFHFLQNWKTQSGTTNIAKLRVLVNEQCVPEKDVCVLSDRELEFKAPACEAGGIMKVVVAVELPLPKSVRGSSVAPIMIRSDICGGAAGYLRYEPEKRKPLYKVYASSKGRQGKALPHVPGQLKLAFKASASSKNMVDNTSDDGMESEATSSPRMVKRRNSNDTHEEGDANDPFVRLSQSTSDTFDSNSGILHSGSKIKKRKIVIDDDEEESGSNSDQSACPAAQDVHAAVMKEALKGLKADADYKHFWDPVVNICRDYLDHISNPMELSTVAAKLSNGTYPSSIEGVGAFAADVRLIWDNCFKYNRDGADICQMAHDLAAVFEECLEKACGKFGLSYQAADRVSMKAENASEEDLVCEEEELSAEPDVADIIEKCKVAERDRDDVLTSEHICRSVVGQEFHDATSHSLPVRISGPWCLLPGQGGCMDSSTLAAHRGSVAALEALSSLHDLWSDAEIMNCHANKMDATEECDRQRSQNQIAPMAGQLFGADLGSFAHSAFSSLQTKYAASDSDMQIAKHHCFTSFLKAKTEAARMVDKAGCADGTSTSFGKSSTGISDDSSDDENAMDEDEVSSVDDPKPKGCDSSDEEAQFDDGNVGRYGARNTRGSLRSDRNGVDEDASGTGTFGESHLIEWRTIGSSHYGYLRYHYRRVTYVKYVSDILCPHWKLRDFKVFHHYPVSRAVSMDVIPMLGNMLRAEEYNSLDGHSSHRSRRAYAKKTCYPYTSEATGLSDEQLSAISQFSTLGEPQLVHIKPAPWD